MTTGRRVLLAMLLPLIALPAAAQSPNTSALIVVVVDQSGGGVAYGAHIGGFVFGLALV